MSRKFTLPEVDTKWPDASFMFILLYEFNDL